MEIIFENFGKSLLIVLWLFCLIEKIVHKHSELLMMPIVMTILYGFYRLLMK
jgi:hypothetical protein